jgi:SAM-dependent methyltransferase
MNEAELIASWQQEEQQPFVGWDFSYLQGRKYEELPPQDYPKRVSELMLQARSVLDLDTGGGEQLLGFRTHWPAHVAATEGYPPNVRLATERLTPLGVQVAEVPAHETSPLPFSDATFDLVLNRHGGTMNITEIARVLTPGGTFLTQQVHGQTLLDLLTVFGATPQWPEATPEHYLTWIAREGLELVDGREYSGAEMFADVGALVYFLRAIPWLVPGFSVATHTEPLLRLHAQLVRGEPLRFITRGYRIEARKAPGSASGT